MLIRSMRIAAAAAILSTLSTTVAFADSGTSLTVYNQDFAVVRETVPLDLTRGNHSCPRASLSECQLDDHEEFGPVR